MQAGMTVDDLSISMILPSEEATLVAELQAGSERAFAELIERYHRPLYSLIARSLQDPAAAADITQEVFLKVFRGIGSFHGDASLRTWLYRIALREASNQRRWWSRHKCQETALDAPCCPSCCADELSDNSQSFASTLADGCCSPFDRAAQQETRERVEAALRLVPENFRRVVVLREIEGMAYEEIAELLQVNLGTVKSRLMRGRAALRAVLAPAPGTPAMPRAADAHHVSVRAFRHVSPTERAGFLSPAGRLRAQATSLPGPTLNQELEVSR